MTEFVLDFAIIFTFVIGNTALATFIAVRAWDHRPARLSVVIIGLLVSMGIAIFGQAIFRELDALYVLRAIFLSEVGLITTAFVALLSAMFMPSWWQGRQPIRYILLPYMAISVLVGVDLLGRTGVFVNGMQMTGDNPSFSLTGLGKLLPIALSASWLLPFGLLATAFVRDRQARVPIIILGGGVVATLFLTALRGALPTSTVLRGLIFMMPIPITLAVAVFRTQLITPMRAAIDQAFETMSDVAIVLNNRGQIAYANPQAGELGFHAHTASPEAPPASAADLGAIAGMRVGFPPQQLAINGRHLVVSLSALRDSHGRQHGTLVLGRDVTEIAERTLQLELERAHLADVVRALESEQRERAALAATVADLALPIIPILDGVLVLPLVGAFDAARMRDLRSRLLEEIERQRASLVMLDLTGLLLLDAEGAAWLTGSIQAARLLGARCVLVGVRPETAEAIVATGLLLGDIPTAATLQEAVRHGLEQAARSSTR